MSLSLGENLSPLPVSISTRLPATSTSRQRVAYSQRLSASHDTSFDHKVLGTTPCMAPPSRRKFPPFSMVSFASPMVSTRAILALCAPAVQGVAVAVGGASTAGGPGGACRTGAAGGAAGATGDVAVATAVFGL